MRTVTEEELEALLDLDERVCEADGCFNAGSTDEMMQDGDEWYCPDHAPDDEDDRVQQIIDLAKENWQEEGGIEIDDSGGVDLGDGHYVDIPVVSEGDDNGAYVRAWVWVCFEGTDLDKNKDVACAQRSTSRSNSPSRRPNATT